VTPVVDATGIWIADKKFGLTWKLVQAMVNVPAEGGRSGCLIVEDGDAPSAGVSSVEESNLMAAVLPSTATAAAEEDEEEEEEEDAEEVVPAPPVPAKKAAPAPAAAAVTKKVVKKVSKA
jgi:hypothetical protein